MESGILSTIGHTPCVRLNKLYDEAPSRWYGKLEMFNPGRSLKDRPAFRMINAAMQSGELNETSTVIESSSGNTAVGLAQVCLYFDLRFIAVVDPKINEHTRHILKAFGAKIEEVTEANEQGNYLSARLRRVRQLLTEISNSYWPNQYKNQANPASHYQTMKEIVDALPHPPDYLLASTSTCGTIMGCANYVQQNGLHTKIVAVDAVGSVIFGSSPANRLVPGHGAGRPSYLLQRSAIDRVIHITDKECITGCRRLLECEAILAGGSSGAVVMAAEKLRPTIPAGSSGVLVLADSGERYLDTVYNDKWVGAHFKEPLPESTPGVAETNHRIKKSLSARRGQQTVKNGERETDIHKIAIIGGGPKGMYGFERLAAEFAAHPPEEKVEIHVYDKSGSFGSGDIYQPHQPPYLLMNNPAGDINMWIDEFPPPVVGESLSLAEWMQRNETKHRTKSGYVSRAVAGRYLKNGFEQIACHLPPDMSGTYRVGEVTDIEKDEAQYRLTLKTAAGTTESPADRYDHILLATGHPRNNGGDNEKMLYRFAETKNKIQFILFIYPVETKLAHIRPCSRVAVKGIGLTFIDAVLSLTEGRGGTFKWDSAGSKCRYQPSGKEPDCIYPYSRSGLPMLPRRPEQNDASPLKFFSCAAVKKRSQGAKKIDFCASVLPLLKQEMTYAYYRVLMQEREFEFDISTADTFKEVQHYINAFHQKYPSVWPFNPDQFLNPLQGKHFNDAEAYNTYIQSYLSFFLAEVNRGEQKSPWAAVTAVWRKATPVFGEIYAFGGLTSDSHRYFDQQFRRLLNRVTFGPPAESTAKIVALMQAGILSFKMAQNPDVTTDKDSGTFLLKSSRYKIQQPVDALIDARISKVRLPADSAPLYKNLLARGLVTMYENKSGFKSYQPGCVAISPMGFAINEEGFPEPGLAVTGTPSEGITFDNDTLSRRRNNFVSNWAASVQKSFTQSPVDVS